MTPKVRMLSKEELYEAIEDAERVSVDSWRHGSRVTYVAPIDGAHWMFTCDYAGDEGLQAYGPTRAERVVPVQVTRTEWVPADD